MNKRLLSIIIAAVFALLGVVLVNAYLNSVKKQYQIQTQETQIVVASRDIPKGSTIQENMLAVVNFPVQYIQPGSFDNKNIAIGKIASVDILKNEQILQTKLTRPQKQEDSLAVRLPKGKRAFTITIDILSAVGGQIKVGDYIDIIGNFPYTQNVGGKPVTENVSVTLFQNIFVMGIASDPSGKLVFTLALTPQESAILSYAMTQGALRFVLRQPLDTAIETVPPIEANALWQYILSTLGQQFVQPSQEQASTKQDSPPEPPPPSTLEIYRGSQRGEMEIER